ncbi:CarD family transcriptional regulator [Clostridium perfringens]|uniref:CarD family transcriptional regulator n=1 Tax=Clostridium perfringens TaxID=1502 RepID=UPI0039EB6138
MFKINDYIMYGTVGVCQVIDITKETLMNNIEKEYYVLSPVYSKYPKKTVIKIPVDNKKISMRTLLSKDDVNSIINSIPKTETLWIDNDRQRNDEFKTMLRSGNCDDLIVLIRSIYLDKKKRKLDGKKACKGDDEIMQTAEKLINEEFAVILDIRPEEVKSYIKSHIPQ